MSRIAGKIVMIARSTKKIVALKEQAIQI